jgi:hypothetical protein
MDSGVVFRTQAARDLGLGEVAFAEKATTSHPSFFNLLRS